MSVRHVQIHGPLKECIFVRLGLSWTDCCLVVMLDYTAPIDGLLRKYKPRNTGYSEKKRSTEVYKVFFDTGSVSNNGLHMGYSVSVKMYLLA